MSSSRDPPSQVEEIEVDGAEALVFSFWALKDLGWVLLLAPLSWPAALVAICLEAHHILLEWSSATWPIRAHNVAAFLWLVGNACWMTCEFLFDFHPFTLPWYSGPYAGRQEENYLMGVHVAQGIFSVGLLGLAVCYIYCLVKPADAESGANPQDMAEVEDAAAQPPQARLAFGVVTREVYMMAFIGPWIIKDIFWSVEMVYPALVFSVVAALLMIDCYYRYRSILTLAELSWLTSNTIWLLSENLPGLDDRKIWPRIVAASFLFLSCGLSALEVYKARKTRPVPQGGTPNERTALVPTSQ